MAIIGGNIEIKEIGLSIGTTGTHYKTVYNSSLNSITLEQITVDGSGNPVYADEGYWTSEVINLGDNFSDFEKLFTTHIDSGSSSLSVETRVSDDGFTWSDWIAVALDGAIQSETKRFIQVKISLYAGFIADNFNIDKNEYVDSNDFVEEVNVGGGTYIVPTLSANVSSSGIAFSSSSYDTASYIAYRAFDKNTATEFITKDTVIIGHLGFIFTSPKRITKYKITKSNAIPTGAPKKWVLEASENTTDGSNGSWVTLDTRYESTLPTSAISEYSFTNKNKYIGYRIKWTENHGYPSYTRLSELDFYESEETALQLKREYSLDMTVDKSWTGEGSLHRKLISRDDWLRVDKMNVIIKNRNN